MPQTCSALELSFRMGETLLENGAEISRVQETMERVVQSYRVDSFNVYVLTNAIFVTGTENGVEHAAKLKHVPSTSTHLGRICAVNQLSREIAQGKHTVEEAAARLDSIEVLPYSPLPLAVLSCAVGSAAFSYLFGGSAFDAFVAFFCGLGNNMDKIIIGSIIRLVPGVALTTSIRDFFHGDYLSGAIRMLDAVLVGGCIAVGVGFVVKALSMVTGGALL